MLRQQGNIFSSFPQRRHMQGHNIQTIKQIFAEAALFYFLFQVFIGSGNYADINFKNFRTADTGNFPFLQNPQELYLHSLRHFAYFIQKNTAAVGLAELSFPLAVGTGESSFFMAE